MSRALDFVKSHCDIEERLELVPPSACVRGIFFRIVEEQLEKAGKIEAYRKLFPGESRSSLPFYPLGDYLLRTACGGALITSPERLQEGMFTITRAYATSFGRSLFGRAIFRLLARDPVRITEQGMATRRQTHTYGRWTMVRHGPRRLEVIYEEEYQWIDSVIAGAARGTYEACGPQVELETKEWDRFNGSTMVRW